MSVKHKNDDRWMIVVDDDIDSRMVTVMCLQHKGVAAVGCANGIEFVKAMLKAVKDNNMPSIIFLDLNMPVFSGWELLEMINVSQPIIKDIPVVLVTGEKVPNNTHYKVLHKPFNIDELFEMVDRVLKPTKKSQ